MRYRVEFKPRAIKDLKSIVLTDRARLLDGIERLENNLQGNVKRLTDFTPEFRLRVGQYRVLFEVQGQRVIVYRVMHRRNALQVNYD